MTPQLYEAHATVKAPLRLEQCHWAVYRATMPPKQCTFKVREWIGGHGYCHRHARRIKP